MLRAVLLAFVVPVSIVPLACSDSGDSPRPASAPRDPAVRFELVDEAAQRGLVAPNLCGAPVAKRYMLESIGNGCALFDKEGDGDLDAFLVDAGTLRPPADPEGDWTAANDGRCRLYENDGRGRFTDVTESSGAGLAAFAQGVAAADHDGDGDVDLYVTCWGPDHLLRNDGHGRFEDATAAAGLGDERWSVSAAFFDADGDDDLDLYVGNYFAMARARDPDCWKKVDCPYYEILASCGPKGMVPEADVFYVNDGDGTFTDATASSGIGAVAPRYALGVVAFDFDRDGDVDVYVANDSRGNFLFQNDGRGRFEEVADLAGCSLNAAGMQQAGMGVACGDFDGDLDLDLLTTNFSHDDNTLFENDGAGSFLDVTARHSFGTESWLALGWGAELVDFDLDGDLDLLVANGHVYPGADVRAPELTYEQRCHLFLNEAGKLRFVSEAGGSGLERLASFRGAAFGDVDDDGDEDVLVVAMNEPPALFINHGLPGAPRRFVTVELEAPGKNRFAIGATVVAEIGTRKLLRFVRGGGSFASTSSSRLHFGLGEAEGIDRLTVAWPDGSTQSVSGVPAGRRLRWKKGAAPEPRLP